MTLWLCVCENETDSGSGTEEDQWVILYTNWSRSESICATLSLSKCVC